MFGHVVDGQRPAVLLLLTGASAIVSKLTMAAVRSKESVETGRTSGQGMSVSDVGGPPARPKRNGHACDQVLVVRIGKKGRHGLSYTHGAPVIVFEKAGGFCERFGPCIREHHERRSCPPFRLVDKAPATCADLVGRDFVTCPAGYEDVGNTLVLIQVEALV
jgi:hypothetical protein